MTSKKKTTAKKTAARKTTKKAASKPAAEGRGRAATSPRVAKGAAKATTPAAKPKAATRANTAGRKPGLLTTAAEILAKAKEPMACPDIVKAALESGWKTNGKTPAATLSAAIHREIKDKGKDARFEKVDRGQFRLAKGA